MLSHYIIWSILTIVVYDHMTHNGISTAVIMGCVIIGLLISDRHVSFMCDATAIGLCIKFFLDSVIVVIYNLRSFDEWFLQYSYTYYCHGYSMY